MNNLGNKIISPNIMEEKEIVEQLKNFLNKYLSEKEVYSQIYEKSNKDEIEINYQIEEKNGKISVSPTIDSEKYKKEFDELNEISTLRDLKRFVIKFQDILIKNISEKNTNFSFDAKTYYEDEYISFKKNLKNKKPTITENDLDKQFNKKRNLENNELFIQYLMKLASGKEIEKKYSQEVKETYDKIGDKIRNKLNPIIDKLNQDNIIENLEEKLKKNEIILGETIDIKNYKRIIEIAKQDERILKLFKINPKFTIKILEKLEKKVIDINFVQEIPEHIISSLNEEKLQENIFDFYNDFGMDFLKESSINLNTEKFQKFLKWKVLQIFVKTSILKNKYISHYDNVAILIGNQIDIWKFLENILDIENVVEYLFLLENNNKYSGNFINFVLYYPEFIKKSLKPGIKSIDVIKLDPTNEKIKYFLEKSDNILLYILENPDLYNSFNQFLNGELKTGFIIKKELTPEEFYDKYIKVNTIGMRW